MLAWEQIRARIGGGSRHGATNTLWAFLSEQGRLALAMLVFVALAASLGADQYAIYGTTIAVVLVLASVSAGGLDMFVGGRLAQLAPGDPERRRLVAQARGGALLGGGLLIVGLLLTQPWLLSEADPVDVLLIAIAELIVARYIEIGVVMDQMSGNQLSAMKARLAAMLPRVVAAGIFVVGNVANSVRVWSYFYLVATIIGALWAWWVVGPEFRRVGPSRPRWPTLRPALPFGANLLGTQARADVDKPMLTSMGSLSDSGNYLAAYRLLLVATTPVNAVTTARYHQFFQARGLAQARRAMSHSTGVIVVLGLLCGLVMVLSAPVVPMVVGRQFSEAVNVMRWLALMPVVRGLQVIAGNAVSGLGFQHLRAVLSWLALAVNVVANLALIPAMGWRGAVLATYVAEGALAVAYWLVMMTGWGLAGGRSDEDQTAATRSRPIT